MIIAHEKLSPGALQGLLEEFVTRDGNDSGFTKRSLEQKVSLVRHQLNHKQAFVVYDPETKTCDIISKESFELYQTVTDAVK